MNVQPDLAPIPSCSIALRAYASDDESLPDEWQPQERRFAGWEVAVQCGAPLHVPECGGTQLPAELPQPGTELQRCCCVVFEDLHQHGCAISDVRAKNQVEAAATQSVTSHEYVR